MWKDIPLLPESASTIAGEYDLLWWFLVGLTVVFTALIFVGVVALVTIYKSARTRPRRRRSKVRSCWSWCGRAFRS
jgi:hypothetical protein